MLAKIKVYFEQFISIQTHSPEEESHALNLAVAAIMIEMIGIDNQVDQAEIESLNTALKNHLKIEENEVNQLRQLAQQSLSTSTDYHQFTSLINSHFELAKKYQIIEALWQLAYADGRIDSHEEHFLRKIAELLHVPHSQFIKAKLSVIPH
jgi:uncharacterized tellurite resistance protein B-like protein